MFYFSDAHSDASACFSVFRTKCRNGIQEPREDLSVPTSNDFCSLFHSKKLKTNILSGVKNSYMKTHFLSIVILKITLQNYNKSFAGWCHNFSFSSNKKACSSMFLLLICLGEQISWKCRLIFIFNPGMLRIALTFSFGSSETEVNNMGEASCDTWSRKI